MPRVWLLVAAGEFLLCGSREAGRADVVYTLVVGVRHYIEDGGVDDGLRDWSTEKRISPAISCHSVSLTDRPEVASLSSPDGSCTARTYYPLCSSQLLVHTARIGCRPSNGGVNRWVDTKRPGRG